MNPIRYRIDVTNPDTPGCAVQVELYALDFGQVPTDDNRGTLITRQTLFPGFASIIYFYCEDFLNSYLTWQLPDIYNELIPGDIIAVQDQIKQYYIRYREITDANTETAWATEVDHIRTVLKGGIAKEKFDRNNFFVNHLPTKKPFLTWQPANQLLGKEEYRYLTYFHHFDSAPALQMKCRVVYTDGTDETVTKDLPALTESLLFHLPASISQVAAALVSAKQIWYYDVSVEDADGNIYAIAYRLYADYRNYYNDFSFIYHNSLGGIDALRVRGEFDIEIQRDMTEIQQAVNYGDDATILPTENAAINISKYEIYKGDAGWFNSPVMQDSVQDMLLSDSVYRILLNRWLRVMHLQKTQTLRGTDDTKWSFPLQWRYTFNNSSYTPLDKDFGAGTNDEDPGPVYGTCTAPTGLLAEYVEDVGDAQKWHFSWDAAAGALSYELQYKADTVTDWTTVTSDDNEEDVILSNDGNYSWRVRSKCGDGDYSVWVNGAGFTVKITADVCNFPLGLVATLVSITGTMADVTLSWLDVPGVVGYQVDYRKVGDTVWQSVSTLVNNVTVTLLKDTQYEWRVRSQCNLTPDYSRYQYGAPFTPSLLSPTCDAPTNLTVEQGVEWMLYRPVNFFWDNAPGVTDYQLQWKFTTSPLWTTVDNINSGVVQNIHVARDVQWRVRSNCTGGGHSAYVNGDNFST